MLVQSIDSDLKKALLSGDKEAVTVFRGIKSALKNEEIKKRSELGEDDALKVIKKEAKKRKEAIEIYRQAGETDRADNELKELKLISEYLPEEKTDEELKAIVNKVVEDAKTDNMGQIMGLVMKEVAGSVDGSRVSKIVREKLQGQC